MKNNEIYDEVPKFLIDNFNEIDIIIFLNNISGIVANELAYNRNIYLTIMAKSENTNAIKYAVSNQMAGALYRYIIENERKKDGTI